MATTKDRIDKKIISTIASRPPAMTKNLIIRVPEELHAKLAELAAEMSREIPGRRATISDVARGILEYGLKERKPTYPTYARREQSEPKD